MAVVGAKIPLKAGKHRASAGKPCEAPLLLLQVWLSPSFPVGAYAYSHGLEMAAEQSLVRDYATLSAWLEDLIDCGSLRSDLILASQAMRAVATSQWLRLKEIVELAVALQPSSERHLEATQQGRSFIEQVEGAWPTSQLDQALREARGGSRELVITYPVAFGLAAGAHAIAAGPALAAYGIAFIGNLASAAIRLSLIGQSEGQRLIAALSPALVTAASLAANSSLDDLGTATFRADLVSMQHESQYTRIFRS